MIERRIKDDRAYKKAKAPADAFRAAQNGAGDAHGCVVACLSDLCDRRKKEEIPSMPGQYRYSVDGMGEKLAKLADAGVRCVLLFGIPGEKDEKGSGAYASDGIVQRALRRAKQEFPGMYFMADLCMCEYTSHRHCGILCGNDVDNDKTLEYLAQIAGNRNQIGSRQMSNPTFGWI